MAPRDSTRPPLPSAQGCPVEAIAQAYLRTTEGDAGQALRFAITDAMADLMASDMRTRGLSRLISRGYVRGGLDEHDGPEAA